MKKITYLLAIIGLLAGVSVKASNVAYMYNDATTAAEGGCGGSGGEEEEVDEDGEDELDGEED